MCKILLRRTSGSTSIFFILWLFPSLLYSTISILVTEWHLRYKTKIKYVLCEVHFLYFLHQTIPSFRAGLCSKAIRMRRFYTEFNETPYSDTQHVQVTAPSECSCQQIGNEFSLEFNLGLANPVLQCKVNVKV